MIRYKFCVGFLLLSMSLSSYAGFFTDDEAHKQIDILRQQLIQQQQQLTTVTSRLEKAETLLQGQGLMELATQMESIRNELSRLRGQNEVASHDIEGLQKKIKDFYVDLDGRLRKLESRGGTSSSSSSGSSKSTAVTSSSNLKLTEEASSTNANAAQTAAPTAAETKMYDAAYALFKAGQYQPSMLAFQNFIKTYPNSSLIPSALYWVGNGFYNLKDYRSTITIQLRLVQQYPDSQKAPDALLNVASAYRMLKDKKNEKTIYTELIDKYPNTPAAAKAKERLSKLK